MSGPAGASNRPKFSFEFFPPKSDEQAGVLEETISRLRRFKPGFVSVTYGAGGTSQPRSLEAVRRLHEVGLQVAAHLTCAGASREALRQTIEQFRTMGIDRFVALRGDAPGVSQTYLPHPFGYGDTAELVSALKRSGARDVSVSAYPERHPDSSSWQSEIDTLKRKADAGADRAITQFFYDNDLYERYRERVVRAGIGIPIVPGIMPIHRFASICNFASRCGTSIPERLSSMFSGIDPDTDAHFELAAQFAAEQVADLVVRGAPDFHIYTLNRADLTEAIFALIDDAGGVRAAA